MSFELRRLLFDFLRFDLSPERRSSECLSFERRSFACLLCSRDLERSPIDLEREIHYVQVDLVDVQPPSTCREWAHSKASNTSRWETRNGLIHLCKLIRREG